MLRLVLGSAVPWRDGKHQTAAYAVDKEGRIIAIGNATHETIIAGYEECIRHVLTGLYGVEGLPEGDSASAHATVSWFAGQQTVKVSLDSVGLNQAEAYHAAIAQLQKEIVALEGTGAVDSHAIPAAPTTPSVEEGGTWHIQNGAWYATANASTTEVRKVGAVSMPDPYREGEYGLYWKVGYDGVTAITVTADLMVANGTLAERIRVWKGEHVAFEIPYYQTSVVQGLESE